VAAGRPRNRRQRPNQLPNDSFREAFAARPRNGAMTDSSSRHHSSPRHHWSSRRVLITGGLGFVGSNLAHSLVAAGAEVTLLDARLPHLGSNPANIAGIEDDVTVAEADVRDADAVADCVADADLVYHCAAQNDRSYAGEHPSADLAINCEGTLNVLEAAKACDPSPRVVYTSSLAVYGRPTDLPVDESTPARPMDLYGAHKRTAEHYCRIYHEQHGVPTTVCRLANVYGPRAPTDTGYGVQGIFVATAVRDETITVFEPGTMQRDIIHVADVVDVLERMGTSEAVLGEEYVLGSGEGTTLGSLARTIVDVAGTGEVELVPWPEEWAKIDRGDVYCDPAKLRAALDWSPKIELETGLRETVEFYRDNRETYL